MRMPRISALALALGTFPSMEALAVRLDEEGRGQALIYPYYSAQVGNAGTMNTYLSVVNGTTQGKAVRVTFRESRAGQDVLSFNLYLAPNDVWTGTVVPTAGGATVLTSDVSCTEPAFTPIAGSGSALPQRTLSSASYVADGMGAGLDRTREGYVEMIEMATLYGQGLASITHNSAGVPRCSPLVTAGPDLSAPTGGLSGTLTLIDVNRGMDFTLRAEALAELSTQPFFRPPGDPYPGFDAGEIAPVSVVQSGRYVYRSQWQRGVDAVNAALMRHSAASEFVLDDPTRSKSDFVVTFPTFHLAAATPAPFPFAPRWAPLCQGANRLPFLPYASNRESATSTLVLSDFPGLPTPSPAFCGVANVVPVGRSGAAEPDSVLGSTSYGYTAGSAGRNFTVRQNWTSGWIRLSTSSGQPRMTSLPGSTRWDTVTGELRAGQHVFWGTPMTAFSVRTFENGTLACTTGSCQGNYGGSFAAAYTREIYAP